MPPFDFISQVHGRRNHRCTVINLATALRRDGEWTVSGKDGWDTELYLAPRIVSPSERAQILERLRAWAVALEVRIPTSSLGCEYGRSGFKVIDAVGIQSSTLPLPSLDKPLRPFFIHPATSYPPDIPPDPPYIPIICVSASRWVGIGGDDVPSATRKGSKTVGFEYVPGGGDDDELWARVSFFTTCSK